MNENIVCYVESYFNDLLSDAFLRGGMVTVGVIALIAVATVAILLPREDKKREIEIDEAIALANSN